MDSPDEFRRNKNPQKIHTNTIKTLCVKFMVVNVMADGSEWSVGWKKGVNVKEPSEIPELGSRETSIVVLAFQRQSKLVH